MRGIDRIKRLERAAAELQEAGRRAMAGLPDDDEAFFEVRAAGSVAARDARRLRDRMRSYRREAERNAERGREIARRVAAKRRR